MLQEAKILRSKADVIDIISFDHSVEKQVVCMERGNVGWDFMGK